MMVHHSITSESYYIRGGWIDHHIVKIGSAFIAAQQSLDRLQIRLDSESWSMRLRRYLPSWMCGASRAS